MPELTLPFLIGAAVIDSINPCAFGVLIYLITYLLKTTQNPRRMVLHGLVYVTAVYVTYLGAGLIVMYALSLLRHLSLFSVISYVVIGIIVIIAGLVEWYDAFFKAHHEQTTLGIRPRFKEKIVKITEQIADKTSTSAFLGIFVALVELPCTGFMYLAVLRLLAEQGFTALNIFYLLIYNVLFVLPLIIIIVLVYKGMTTLSLKIWYEKHKKWMRIVIGTVLIALGIWMIHQSIGFDWLFNWFT